MKYTADLLFATAIEQSCGTEKSQSQSRGLGTYAKALEADEVRWHCRRTAATTQGDGNGIRLPPGGGSVIAAGTCPRPKNNCRLRAPRDIRNGDRGRWWIYIVLRGTSRSSPESGSRS